MISRHKLNCLSACVLSAFLTLACGSSGDDSDDSDNNDEETSTSTSGGSSTSGAELGNVLAAAYPGSLALSAFPQAVNDSTSLLLQDKEVEDPNAGKTVRDKVVENQKILKGEAERCLNLDLFKQHKGLGDVSCYNFDSDMNLSRFTTNNGTQEFGTADGTDGKGEACMVTFARKEVQDAVAVIDKALALVSGMLCQAKKDDENVALPGEGESLDLASSFEEAGEGQLPVTEAKLSRLDDIDGQAVYRSDIKIKDPSGTEMEVHLVHSPGENDTGVGTLWFISGPQSQAKLQEIDFNNTANKNSVMSINYAKEVDGDDQRMRVQVRRAQIVNTIDPVTKEGLVNYAGVPQEAENADIHAINYVAFDVNPENNEGNLSYWMNPGGRFDESARGFLFNMTAQDSGELAGCGISGATSNVSIRKHLSDPDTYELKPVRYWHPTPNGGNQHPDKDPRYEGSEGAFITEQCFSQSSEGVYAIDSEKTSHERGYEVIATDATEVVPPPRPKQKLEAQFN